MQLLGNYRLDGAVTVWDLSRPDQRNAINGIWPWSTEPRLLQGTPTSRMP